MLVILIRGALYYSVARQSKLCKLSGEAACGIDAAQRPGLGGDENAKDKREQQTATRSYESVSWLLS
jgi:hypothetical protein